MTQHFHGSVFALYKVKNKHRALSIAPQHYTIQRHIHIFIMPSYELVYFNGRGRAEASRMLFALSDTKYTDYRLKDGEWTKYKDTTPLAQVPILKIDGGKIVLSQSRAIERYLAREFGFYGKNNIEIAKVDMVIDTLDDLLKPALAIYSAKAEEKEAIKQKVLKEDLPKYLNTVEKLLKFNGANPKFLVGDSVTLCDLVFLSTLNMLAVCGVPADLAKKPLLKELEQRILKLPKIEKWVKTRQETPF